MWKYIGIFIGGIIGISALGLVLKILLAPLNVAHTAVNSAQGVITRTLDPNNVITKYEWFHDANGIFNTRLDQIKRQKLLIEGETDSAEKTRLRVELSGIQAACTRIANEYNANATKTNVSIFQGREAPPTLNTALCN